jgi:exodeoxyribonuclease-3
MLSVKIATFNVNGVNGRLPVLLRWLEGAKPDVLCLQELKAPQDKFPEAAPALIWYRAIWAKSELIVYFRRNALT